MADTTSPSLPEAQWYLAELIQEIRVESSPGNLLWRTLTLIQAASPDQAWQKAHQFGRDGETEHVNTEGQTVRVLFRGVSDLLEIQDELKDGAELLSRSEQNVSEQYIARLVRAKDHLSLFQS